MSEPVLNVSSMFGFGSGLPGAIWMYSERRPDVQCLLGWFLYARLHLPILKVLTNPLLAAAIVLCNAQIHLGSVFTQRLFCNLAIHFNQEDHIRVLEDF